MGRHLVALLVTAAAVAGVFGSSVAFADSPVVFSQTDNLWGEYTSQHNTSVAASTYYAPGDTASVYDNFTLGVSASVALITWHGAYYDGPPQPLQPGDPGSNGPGSNGAGSYGYGPADPGTITGFTIRFYSDVIDSSGGPLNGLHRPNLEAGPIHTSIIAGNAGETDLHAVDSETIYYGPNEMYSYSAALSTPFTASAGTQYWISIVAESAFPPEWGWDTAGLNGYNTGPGGPWFDPSVSLSYRQDQGDITLRRNISGGDFTFSLSVDATPPVIAAHSDITVTSTTAVVVTYTAPSATDNVDATAPASCTPASGSTFALGTTTVTCNKSDTAGNTATPTTFTVTVTPPAPTVTMSALASSVTTGDSSTISWSSTNATSCTASGDWSGSQATSGSASTGVLNVARTFTYNLSCTGLGGSGSGSTMVVVNLPPTPSVSIGASPASVTTGAGSTLTWSSSNTTGCTASGNWSGSRATSGSVSTGALNSAGSYTYSLSCTGPGGTASGSVTVTATPPPTPPTNQPQSSQAKPDQPGTVTVTVAPTGTASAVPVAVTWPSGTFTTPVDVTVTPKPGTSPSGTPTPVGGGFAVGGTVVQLNVTTTTGAAVTSFLQPLQIHLPSLATGEVPGYSRDGTSWTTIPRLFFLPLLVGQEDGYYLNTDGSVDIYTRHATLFGLLKDTQAPSKPKVKATAISKKLYLLVTGAKDNVRVTGYRLSFNGRVLKSTNRAYVVLPAHTGRYQVQVFDAAGNLGRPATFKVVGNGSKKHPFKVAKG